MSWSADKTQKYCLTCDHWDGDRELTYANRAETDSPSTRGKCYAGVFADATPGPVAMAGRQCGKYRKWDDFR